MSASRLSSAQPVLPDTPIEGGGARVRRLTDGLIATVLIACLITLYLATESATPMSDGVCYCVRIASGDPGQFLSGGQHLLYHVVGYVLHAALSTVHPLLPVWDTLTLFSAISGALCVALFYLACRTLGLGRGAALPAGLLLGVSIEFWRHAVNVEHIMPNALAVCVFFLAITRCVTGIGTRPELLLGVAFGFCVLGHLSHVMLAPALLVTLLTGEHPRRRLVRTALAATLVVAGGYAVCAWIRFGTIDPTQVARWVLLQNLDATGPNVSPWWVWRAKNLLWVPIWQLGAVVDDAHIRHLLWAPDRFNGALPVMAAASVAGIGLAGARAAVLLPRRSVAIRRAFAALVAWLLPYAVFFAFWCPAEGGWWVTGLMPVCFLVGLGLGGARTNLGRTLLAVQGSVLVTMVAAVNLSGPRGILTEHRDTERSLAHLLVIRRDARIGDIGLWLGYLSNRHYGPDTRDVRAGVADTPCAFDVAEYFLPIPWYGTHELVFREGIVRSEVERTLRAGRTVWVSLSGCDIESTVTRTRAFDTRSAGALRSFLHRYELVPSGTPCLWTLRLHIEPWREAPA